jgi:guanylate kinase
MRKVIQPEPDPSSSDQVVASLVEQGIELPEGLQGGRGHQAVKLTEEQAKEIMALPPAERFAKVDEVVKLQAAENMERIKDFMLRVQLKQSKAAEKRRVVSNDKSKRRAKNKRARQARRK